MSGSDIDFLPKGLFNENGGYVLQTAGNCDLVKFVWTGALLPANEQDFKRKFHISDDSYNRLKDILGPLIAVYAKTQKSCSIFQTTTYPNLVAIASSILDYAENVGGDMDDSYYGIIFDDILLLGEEKDHKETKRLTKQIKTLINTSVGEIDKLTTQANGVITDLRAFEKECQSNQSDLQDTDTAVHKALEKDGGDIEVLKKEIQDVTDQINLDQKEYDHDVVVATTAATYVWIPIAGTIAAAVVMGVYGAAAAKMKNDMDRLQSIIETDSETLRQDYEIFANLTTVNTSLDLILKKIGPAITVIEEMIGQWGAIRDDLTSIKDFMDKDVRKAQSIIAGIQKKKVITKWNDLAGEIRKYRENAYVSTPLTVSADEYIRQLSQVIGK